MGGRKKRGKNMDLEEEEDEEEKSNWFIPDQRITRSLNLNRHVSPEIDDDDEDDIDSDRATVEIKGLTNIPRKRLYPHLEQLFKSKSSERENALKILVEQFEQHFHFEFAKGNFVTLVHRCQQSLRRGSALEIDLALHLIGLVALTLGAGDNAHEIFEESLVFLPPLLKSKSSHSIKVIECLSIVTLVSATDFTDTERSMEIIWQFINRESKSNGTKYPSSVTAAAISAWALLLSDINGWTVDHKKWKRLIPYLLKQLEEGAVAVKTACIEALALIFENGSLEKFSDLAEEYETIKDMKDDIIKHVKRACNGTKHDTSKLLEDDYNKTATLTICGRRLTLSTWSKLKQINYLRRYLGHGFTNHMMANEHLHDIFHFVAAPAMKCSLYRPEFDKVVVQVFLPDVRREDCSRRLHLSKCSLLSKGKTKLMTKYRMLAEENKAGHFTADEELY